MKKTKENVKDVSYQEWYDNFHNDQWEGWDDLEFIYKTYLSYTHEGREKPWPVKVTYFLNNWLLEEEIKKRWDLDYYGEGHDKLLAHPIYTPYPDFIDNYGRKVEIKQRQTLRDGERIRKHDWHNADIRLLYVRDSNTLWTVDHYGVALKCIDSFIAPRVYYTGSRI